METPKLYANVHPAGATVAKRDKANHKLEQYSTLRPFLEFEQIPAVCD